MFPAIDPLKLIEAATERGETPDRHLAAEIVQGANAATIEIRNLEKETNPRGLTSAEHHSATVAFVREIQRVGLMNVDASFSQPFRD